MFMEISWKVGTRSKYYIVYSTKREQKNHLERNKNIWQSLLTKDGKAQAEIKLLRNVYNTEVENVNTLVGTKQSSMENVAYRYKF